MEGRYGLVDIAFIFHHQPYITKLERIKKNII